MNLEQVSDNIYANMEGKTGGNVGIILLEEGVAAIDAQYPVSGLDFRHSINSVTHKPVAHLLLTHYHGDHVLGSLAFEDCEIVAHHLLYKVMEENLRTIWAPVNVEKLIEEVRRTRPDRVWLYEGFRVVMPTRVFDERFSQETFFWSVHFLGLATLRRILIRGLQLSSRS
jgi:glyoxylase-like metal-dependent hydrolase (beta-lactamase superfamily II)